LNEPTTMNLKWVCTTLLIIINVNGNNQNSTKFDYSYDEAHYGQVRGSWSTYGSDSKYTYECSGIAGATDC